MKRLIVVFSMLILSVFNADAAILKNEKKVIKDQVEEILNDEALIQEKVLICGVCKNVEKAYWNIRQSATLMGAQFLDYKIVIYEDNSTDNTKMLYMQWAKSDPRVLFMSEDVSEGVLAKQLSMRILNRIELIARARNKVLDEIMKDKYEGFKYVIWADLDFLEPWDVEAIVETILYPEEEWDAVFPYGTKNFPPVYYDTFAFRDRQCPIGFELIGNRFWRIEAEFISRIAIDPDGPWWRVYSAFGGMGIYKRASIKGCRYSGVVTKDMEKAVAGWLKDARASRKKICFLDEYEKLLSKAPVYELITSRMANRSELEEVVGVKMKNAFGNGEVIWFSCTPNSTLPWTCEHVPFHSSMALRGHGKLFINPRWKTRWSG